MTYVLERMEESVGCIGETHLCDRLHDYLHPVRYVLSGRHCRSIRPFGTPLQQLRL